MSAAVCVAFRCLLSFDDVPVFRDLLLFIVPIKHFLVDHWRRGAIPFWNPWISLGSPFIGAMHTGAFYPPSVLLLLPLPLGFNLFLLSHYLIALFGMWRLLASGRGLGWASAALGSLTFALGGYMVSLLNIPKELHGATWLPWALLFWMQWLRRGAGRDFALTAVVLALQILGGAVETMLMTVALLTGLTVLQATARERVAGVRAVAGLVGVVAVAGALTAFQLLPTLEYGLQSGRASALSADQVLHWSLQPVSLAQLALPISGPAQGGVPALGIGLERVPPMLESLYLGVPALCLAFGGVTGGREARFWGLVLVLGLLTALGSSTPLLPLLYQAAPGLFGKLRYPEKFLLLFHLSIVMLAAGGLAKLETGRSTASLAAIFVAGLLVVTGAALWWVSRYDPWAYLNALSEISGRTPTAVVPVAEALKVPMGRLVALAACVLGVLLLARRALVGPTVAALLLVLLESVDLLSIRWRSLVTTPWRTIEATRPLVNVEELRERGQSIFHYSDVVGDPADRARFRQAQWPMSTDDWISEYRILWGALFGNVSMVYRVGNVGGADGIQRRDMKVLLDVLPGLSLDDAARLLGRLGVAYMIGPSVRQSPLLELVQAGEGGVPFVYRVQGAAPFARIAARVHVESSEAEALKRLARLEFDSRLDAIVEEPPQGWKEPPLDPAADDTMEMVTRDDELIELRVVAASERLVVVNVAAFSGWKATVDGRSAPIVRTNGLVQGVRVPRGEHRVKLWFEPPGFWWGVLSATIAAAGLGVLAFPGRSA